MGYPAKLTKENSLDVSRKIHCLGINEIFLANLAIALKHQGYEITTSVESNPEPYIANKLVQNHILPQRIGLDANNIHPRLDGLIIGRKIDAKNVEVEMAHQLGVPVYIYADYIHKYAQDKQRIVVTGIEEITDILLTIFIYVLRYWNRSFDYITTSSCLDESIKISDAPIILLQADGHAASTLDQRPQFLAYDPHIVVISSLDKISPEGEDTLDRSVDAFNALADSLPKAGSVIYNADIPVIRKIGEKSRIDVKNIAYRAHSTRINNKKIYLITPQSEILITNSNKMTLEAIAGAYSLLEEVAITEEQFYEAISTFPNL
ncbi:MAG: hypothetical protein BGO68_02660 [Candidatus Amoebophilus sp. 36-38]|nr:MAG: hypothetical protein BGO68_02660 [Candidatus Amoebophilus sp. 36-38]